MIITLANNKGGCTKSTTAVHLCDELTRIGQRVVLFDIDDDQHTSSFWVNNSDELTFPAHAMEAVTPVVRPQLEAAFKSKEFDVIVVDCPGTSNQLTLEVLMLSDIVLIPCQVSNADLKQADSMLKLTCEAQKLTGGQRPTKVHSFLTRGRPQGSKLQDIIAGALRPTGTLLDATISERVAVAEATVQMSTVFNDPSSGGKKASEEFRALFKEVLG